VLLGSLSVAWQIVPQWCGIALMAGSPLGVSLTMIPRRRWQEGLYSGKLSRRWAACLGWWLATTSSEQQDAELSDLQERVRGAYFSERRHETV
jgi:hypothetical protein